MAGPSSSLHELKILLLGDTATGKHCYVTRLVHSKFPNDTCTNKEYDIWSIKIKIDKHTEVPIQIINIHGSERGKSRIKKYFKNIDGYMIMFDVTRPETYDNVIGWKKNVDDENKPVKIPCILLANKCDLEKDEEIRDQMVGINNYCEALGFCTHFETSSRDNIGILESFQHFIREIHRARAPPLSLSEKRARSLAKQKYTIKILVIGDSNTGKTAMIQRYVKNTFSAHYLTTIGCDLAFKKIQYHNDVIVNIHIWDIAADERFRSMTRLFYKDAAGCLVVFDVSRASTLDAVVKWKSDFDKKVNFDNENQVPCLLVGNKCDLMKDGIVTNETHMTDFCRTHKFIRWFETSARENINIGETFLFLVNEIMKNVDNATDVRSETFSEIITINDRDLPKHTFHNCCNS